MKLSDVPYLRMINQRLLNSDLSTPADVVKWMIAMQSQEFAHAKWAIALRLDHKVAESLIQKAFDDGDILRTHLMRPTWHFVSPEDIRWLVELTAPRVHALNAYMYRQCELTPAILKRSGKVLAAALEGNQYLTRETLAGILKKKKITASRERLSCIMMYAELERIICSGPRIGKSFTYALMDERAPASSAFDRTAALADFTRRYFRTRGPAQPTDLAYWSGLSLKDVKTGIDHVKEQLHRELIEGKEHFMVDSPMTPQKKKITFLMPDYEEFGMSYKDRSALSLEKKKITRTSSANHWFIIDGKIAGGWTQVQKSKSFQIGLQPFFDMTPAKTKELTAAIKRYAAFFGKSVEITFESGD